MALTRAAITSGARQASKLEANIEGGAKPQATRTLTGNPNPYMTMSQFIARIYSALKVDTTSFIVPVLDRDLTTQIGYYPIIPSYVEAYDYQGTLWYRFHFRNSSTMDIEAYRVGVIRESQYTSDLFGDGNSPIDSTLNLMYAQDEAQQNALTSSATLRFLGRVNGQIRDEDIASKRKRFIADNLSVENEGGIAIYDNTFSDVTPITSKAYTIDSDQMKQIDDNVFRYFGTNDAIITNSFDENQWNAFYEGQIEPFAIQLSEVLTTMTFTPYEIACGNRIMFSSNRLAYASNQTKLNVTTQLIDRGVMTLNQALDIWQLPGIGEEGDKRIIRGEYIDAALISDHTLEDAQAAIAATNGGTNATENQ